MCKVGDFTEPKEATCFCLGLHFGSPAPMEGGAVLSASLLHFPPTMHGAGTSRGLQSSGFVCSSGDGTPANGWGGGGVGRFLSVSLFIVR